MGLSEREKWLSLVEVQSSGFTCEMVTVMHNIMLMILMTAMIVVLIAMMHCDPCQAQPCSYSDYSEVK